MRDMLIPPTKTSITGSEREEELRNLLKSLSWIGYPPLSKQTNNGMPQPARMKLETDPNGRDPHEKGSKLDEGKSPLYRGVVRYFPRALERVAEVSSFGANKYTWGGWRSVPNGIDRYSDAIVRHLVKEEYEGDYDKDSGLLHASHTAWNALAVLELKLDEMEGRVKYAEEVFQEEKSYNEGVGGIFWGVRDEGC